MLPQRNPSLILMSRMTTTRINSSIRQPCLTIKANWDSHRTRSLINNGSLKISGRTLPPGTSAAIAKIKPNWPTLSSNRVFTAWQFQTSIKRKHITPTLIHCCMSIKKRIRVHAETCIMQQGRTPHSLLRYRRIHRQPRCSSTAPKLRQRKICC